MGGIHLVIMDDLARSVTQQEIPIGLLTAVLNAPVFATLFVRLGMRGWSHD